MRALQVALVLTLTSSVSLPQNAAAHPGNEHSAVLIIGQGGLGDQSYNDLGHRGFTQGLAQTGLTGRVVETSSVVAEGGTILRQAASSGAGLVIDLEYSHSGILQDAARDFPDCHFVILNQVASGSNVTSVLFEEQQGSFLAGVLAAGVVRQAHLPGLEHHQELGVIGGTRSVGIDKFIAGFVQGAHSVDPELAVRISYANTFSDPAKGLEMAHVMYDGGVGIIYAVAGTTGVGVIHAAAQSGLYAIGVDQDEDGLAPGHVLTSMLKHTEVALDRVVIDYAHGRLAGGSVVHMGLGEDGVGLTEMRYTRAFIPASVLQSVTTAREDIVSGRVHVWNVVTQGYPDFMR